MSVVSRRTLLAGAGGLAAGAVAGTAEAKPRKKPPRTHVKAFSDGVGMRDYSLVVGPPPGDPEPIENLPPQPGSVIYGQPPPALTSDYGHPGGMVLATGEQIGHAEFQAVSAGGGHVLVYLDAIVWTNNGPYHTMLYNASTINGTPYSAVPKWPGPVSANASGDLADFRPGSVMHTEGKLEAVLEEMVADSPHIAGFFMDDVGSRSWFPNFTWSTFGAQNQQDYRDGAIAVCQAARNVCDNHGLIFMVNGTWTSGTLAASGGGYPVMGTHGLSLAEGGCVEHHDGEEAFWGPYMDQATSQWGEASPITAGKPFCFVIASSSSGVTAWRNDNKAAWISNQPSGYDGVAPWDSNAFHSTGLPSSVGS
jgi:hypothetical protein